MQRKKVLFLITKSNWGGAQRYVYDLATTLDQTIYEPIVALGGNGELKDKLVAANIQTIILPNMGNTLSFKKLISIISETTLFLKKIKPDILHCNSSIAGFSGVVAGRKAKINKIIFTAHGWAFNEDRPYLQRVVFKFFHWLTVLLSHTTIAVSKETKKQLNWPLAQQRMIVINPGRTIPEFQSRLTARTTLALSHPPLVSHTADVWLCTVAELHPIKQHLMLFKVMKSITKEFPNVRLICIGDGELRTQLETYIQDNKLEQHIFLIGHVHEAATTLKAADLFVLPSKSESYGYVLHEAGLARVPIIASNVGGITDIISSEHEGTLIDPTKPETLELSIRNFLQSPYIYNEKTQKLQSKLTDRTVTNMTTQTVKVYGGI